MAEHIFLQNQCIEEADLVEVLDLTATGKLEWGRDNNAAAIGSNVDYSLGAGFSIQRNLLSVRAGFLPEDWSFNYVRLTDLADNHYYVENFPAGEPLLPLAERVLKLGLIAINTESGRLAGTIKDCANCKKATGHIALYSSVHGVPGTILAGSEHTECVSCGKHGAA